MIEEIFLPSIIAHYIIIFFSYQVLLCARHDAGGFVSAVSNCHRNPARWGFMRLFHSGDTSGSLSELGLAGSKSRVNSSLCHVNMPE